MGSIVTTCHSYCNGVFKRLFKVIDFATRNKWGFFFSNNEHSILRSLWCSVCYFPQIFW